MRTQQWMLCNNIFGSTVLEIMLADPNDRERIEEKYHNRYSSNVGEPWEEESYNQYLCVFCAVRDMGNRTVDSPFPGWYTYPHKDITEQEWWIWMNRNLNG